MKVSKKSLGSISIALLMAGLAGCDSDSVEKEKTNFLCTTVENSKIDGSTGLRDIVIAGSGNETVIGYMNNNDLVPHSECSAAVMSETGSVTKFKWFLFGQSVADSDNDNITSIQFTPDNNVMQIEVTRISNQGVPITENVERPIDDTDASNSRITRRVWDDELLIDKIVAQNGYLDEAEKKVTANIGTATKEIVFDDNAQQWICKYVNSDGQTTIDAGCANETQNDSDILGIKVNLKPYYDSLSTKIKYEVDEGELKEDVERFYDIL